jgi:hypothetical protein
MPLDINELSLMSGVLEFRYAPRFVIWDKIGGFWADILANSPDATVKHADPNKTVISISPTLEGTVAIDRAHLSTIASQPDLSVLKKFAKRFTADLVDKLDISVFTRIGFRTIYFKNFKEKAAAYDFVLSNARFPQPNGPHFGFLGAPKEPELALRWEGEKQGCLVRLAAKTQRVDIDFPANFDRLAVPIDQRESHTVTVDVDYYMTSETAVDLVDVDDLLNTWGRVIRRDIGKFLNGK